MTSTVLFSILLFFAILILPNMPAPLLGIKFETETKRLWFAPPGFVIPIVWFVLFTMLGIARHRIIQTEQPNLQWWLFSLAFLCATYAYYTLGFEKLTHISALWFGLWGNIAVILMAAIAAYKLSGISTTATYLTIPVIIWTLYATAIVLGEMKEQRLI